MDDGDQFWMARAVDNGEGKGSCILKQVDKRCSINNTAFTAGDYAICVEWWDRVAADGERRTFEKWDTSQSGLTQFICNSTELRMIEPEFVADMFPVRSEAVQRPARQSTLAAREATAGPTQFILPEPTETQALETLW